MKSSNSPRFSTSAQLSSVQIISSPFIRSVLLGSSRFPPTFLSLLESLSTADKSLAEIVRKYRFHILDYLGRHLGRYTRWVILAEHFLICRVRDF